MEGRRTDRSTNILDEGSYTPSASVAGWCNWQHTSLWIWELGFESLPGSFGRRSGDRSARKRAITDPLPGMPSMRGMNNTAHKASWTTVVDKASWTKPMSRATWTTVVDRATWTTTVDRASWS